jgi:hypothetical protein
MDDVVDIQRPRSQGHFRSFSHGYKNPQSILSHLLAEVAASTHDKGKSAVSEIRIRRFKHGDVWSGIIHGEDGPSQWTNKMNRHVSETEIKDEYITNFDLDALIAAKDELASQYKRQMEESLRDALEEALVNREPIDFRTGDDPREIFRRMWKDIKIGLDDNLEPTTPVLWAPPDLLEKLSKAAESVRSDYPEFGKELATMRGQKYAEALIEYFENFKKFDLHELEIIAIDDFLSELRQSLPSSVHES